MDAPTYKSLTQTFAEIAQLQNTPAQEKLVLVKAALEQAKSMADAKALLITDNVFLHSNQIMDALNQMFTEEECRNYNYYGEAVKAIQDTRSVIPMQAVPAAVPV